MGILANSVKIGVLLSAAGPVAAQSAREQPRVVTMPDGRTVSVVPAQRGDTRTKKPPVRTVFSPDGRTIYAVEVQRTDTRTQMPRGLAADEAAHAGSQSQHRRQKK